MNIISILCLYNIPNYTNKFHFIHTWVSQFIPLKIWNGTLSHSKFREIAKEDFNCYTKGVQIEIFVDVNFF